MAKNGHAALDPAKRLFALFAGNTRSSGRFNPRTERAFTEAEPAKLADFEAHVEGKVGVGVVPIQDDDTCTWAALDIDNHESDEDIPIGPVAEKIAQHKLPLIPCRSKSGGIHAYVFFDKPQPCQRIRGLMAKWAGLVGHGGCEVFPKQGRLAQAKDGVKQFGNWLNLPYLEGDASNRYAVRDGKKLSLEEFLNWAEGSRVRDADLRSSVAADHPEAPPCVQKMFAHGVAQGHRNEALYAVSVYMRKAEPETYSAKAIEANGQIFAKPLNRAEALRTITSASRAEYGYRCNEEPCRSLCDRGTCLTRKFGITPADAERLDTVEALPGFSNLIKYISEPVKWELTIDTTKITNISTPQLLDFRAMRELISDRLTRLVPLIKNSEWERILQPLMKDCRIVETPDDASIPGLIREKVKEFASKTDLTNRGQDKDDRKGLLRGLPVVQVVDGERCVVFRSQDFVSYLKRTKSEELKGINLWMAAKELGVKHTRFRVPGPKGHEENINVWHIPVKLVMGTGVEAPEYKSEL